MLVVGSLAACGGGGEAQPSAILSAPAVTAPPAAAPPTAAAPAPAAPSTPAPARAPAPAAPPAAAPAPSGPNLRILPYLQQPTAEGVLVTWFTGRDEPGRLEVTGPGLAAPRVSTSTPELRPEMAYSNEERAEDNPRAIRIEGVTPGTSLRLHSTPTRCDPRVISRTSPAPLCVAQNQASS